MDWMDVTSYGQGAKKRITNVWKICNQGVELRLVKKHINYPGMWLVSWSGTDEKYELGTHEDLTLEQAKKAAIEKILGEVNQIRLALEGMKGKA